MKIDYAGGRVRRGLGVEADGPNTEKSSVDMAWLVLDAANDLDDELAVAACRRVIDASLNGVPASPADLHIVQDYFR